MSHQIPLESLPDGTALEVMLPVGLLQVPHQGVLQRAWNGEPLVHQNSKRHGRAVTTTFWEFSNGGTVTVVHIPRTAEESSRITESARTDVARGILWTVGDNCQDFVSRAVTGRNGSKTRDGLVVVSIFGLVAWLFLG
jgi:hypothetical protein